MHAAAAPEMERLSKRMPTLPPSRTRPPSCLVSSIVSHVCCPPRRTVNRMETLGTEGTEGAVNELKNCSGPLKSSRVAESR